LTIRLFYLPSISSSHQTHILAHTSLLKYCARASLGQEKNHKTASLEYTFAC